jgi:hypothetical protein
MIFISSIFQLLKIIFKIKLGENNEIISSILSYSRKFFSSNSIKKNDVISPILSYLRSFLAHLAKGNVSFCHHLASVVR